MAGDSEAQKKAPVAQQKKTPLFSHWRMELNNWMSKQTGGTKRVRWEHALKPPKHEPTHYAKVFVDDTEHGRGEGRTKDQAEELAAKAALTALSPQLAEQLEKEYKLIYYTFYSP